VLAEVGVVVVTHQSAGTVEATLAALPLAGLAGTVVVDNGSTDGGPEQVAALGLPGLRVVRQPNLGFGAGCQRGVDELPRSAELVLFLNPDAVLEAASLSRLVAWLHDHPACAVVGPRVLSAGTPSFSAGRLATLRSELRPLLPDPLSRLGRPRRLPPDHATSGVVGYVEGGCFLVRRAALEQVGGFDPGYFLYFEELELAQRLRRHGWEVHLCAEASVEHAIGTSREGLPFTGRPHLVASCVRYLWRWQGPAAARTWVLAARASWALRVRLGRLDAEEAGASTAAARAALAELSHG
jgi:N-acetylglucosaminyl-diphospho-decaprenol L-rhamnosyltransferase